MVNTEETKTNSEINENVENETTVKEVDLPEENKDDISVEESISMKRVNPESEEVKKITDEQKDYLLKRAKESNIDWDKVEFEEDGLTPSVTDEEKKIFAAITSEFFDYETIELYIEQANFAIADYKEMKAHIDSGMADETDLEHYKFTTQGYEDARIVLAMLQQESRKLEKEFKESKIAEDFIKGITLKTLRDFVVDKYKLTDSWYNPENKPAEELDTTKEIEESIMNNMFVTTLLRQMVKRYRIKSKHSQLYNIFGEKVINDTNHHFIEGLQSYINNLPSHDNVDVKTVITRDFKCLDFINATVLYPLIYFNDPIINEMPLTAEEKELFVTKLDPKGYYSLDDSEKVYEKLYKSINNVLDKLVDVSNVERILAITNSIVKTNKLYKEISATGIDLEDYPKYIAEIAKRFPAVNGVKLMNWGSVYEYMNKYETYITYAKLYAVITDSSRSEVEKRRAAFNTLKSVLGQWYMCLFGEIVTCIDDHITEVIWSKEPRKTTFAMVLKNLILQHELGYKADFIPNEDSTGEKLYEKAKTVFGSDYDYMIGTEKDDILLKHVDLTNVRKEYVKVLIDMVDTIYENYENIFNDSYIVFKNNFDTEVKVNKTSKKKNKKNKR